MKEKQAFTWRTEAIDKKCKYLLLGSFTSDGGADYYYYASSRNHFWYLLDTVLMRDISFDDDVSCKDIKDTIISKDGFAKLITDLKNEPEDKRDKKREEIHERLLEHSFDICDLFESVQVRNPKLNSDVNIIVEDSKISDLNKMLKGCNVEVIYCTSDYVYSLLKNKYPKLGNKAKILIAPTTGNRVKLITKIDNWRKIIK